MVMQRLDALVTGRNCQRMGEHGTNEHFLIELDGRKIFYKILKTLPPSKRTLVKSLMMHLDRKAIQFILAKGEQDLFDFSQSLIEIEAKRIGAWKAHGIHVPEIIGYTKTGIAYDYVDGSVNFKKLLAGTPKPQTFEALLDAYHKIRCVARTEVEANLLHSDPDPENFLYVHKENLIMPIDPGHAINPAKSFEEVDAKLNLRFLYSLFGLKTGEATLRGYLEAFAERLNPSEAGKMMKNNNPEERLPKAIAVAYFALREPFAALVMNRPRRELTDILEAVLPQQDSCMKEMVYKVLQRRAG